MVRPALNVWRETRGVALLEFALLLPLLVVLLLGLFDIGDAAQQDIWLSQAVRAGGQIALAFPTNPGGVIQAGVENAMPGWNVTVSPPTMACFCASGGTVSCSTGTCSSGNVQRYIGIAASIPFAALLIPLTTIQATYVERIQ